MSTRSRTGVSVPGIILIVIGALFLANSLDLLDIGDLLRRVWRLWPIILIAIGVKMVSESRRARTRPPEPPTS